jgi:hypothetical protein
MEIVTKNSDEDLARHRAMKQVRYALAEMAANLLRVIRGAGRSNALPAEALAFVKAVVAYQEIAEGDVMGPDVLSILDIEHSINERLEMPLDHQQEYLARDEIIRGALQLTASKILNQKPQEAAGRSEMFAGIRALEAHRAKQLRAGEAESRAKQVPRRRPKVTRRKAQSDATS